MVRVLNGRFFVDDLAELADQERVTTRVVMQAFGHRGELHLHPGLPREVDKHGPDLVRAEAHVDIEVSGDVPWAVELRLASLADLQLQRLHVVDTGEHHRAKRGVLALLAKEVFLTKQPKEAQEHLTIAGLIHFIDQQHHIAIGRGHEARDEGR